MKPTKNGTIGNAKIEKLALSIIIFLSVIIAFLISLSIYNLVSHERFITFEIIISVSAFCLLLIGITFSVWYINNELNKNNEEVYFKLLKSIQASFNEIKNSIPNDKVPPISIDELKKVFNDFLQRLNKANNEELKTITAELKTNTLWENIDLKFKKYKDCYEVCKEIEKKISDDGIILKEIFRIIPLQQEIDPKKYDFNKVKEFIENLRNADNKIKNNI